MLIFPKTLFASPNPLHINTNSQADGEKSALMKGKRAENFASSHYLFAAKERETGSSIGFGMST